jgi:hypothetical protein
MFLVSVADKGLTVDVSGLESTVVDGCASVDSKEVTARNKSPCKSLVCDTPKGPSSEDFSPGSGTEAAVR